VLRRLTLRDFVIVPALELEFGTGFSVLTGETGAGKSILVDALQLALGGRGDAGAVREGAARADIALEFDPPESLATWLDDAGFATGDTLLLRRSIDAQGRSRAWINGGAATVAQLREAAEHLVDIHGQHAWQGLTKPAAARELLDRHAGIATGELSRRFAARKVAAQALEQARQRGDELARERERLAWQIGELDRLAPGDGEWETLSAEHDRLAHAQALIEAARDALDAVADGDRAAEGLAAHAAATLSGVVGHDARLAPVIDVLGGALAQLQDAAHSLSAYLGRAEVEPQRLAEVDARLSAWLGLARRFRRPASELPALLAQ
jgi:DNA repair protein RecN (Recombination protein N)